MNQQSDPSVISSSLAYYCISSSTLELFFAVRSCRSCSKWAVAPARRRRPTLAVTPTIAPSSKHCSVSVAIRAAGSATAYNGSASRPARTTDSAAAMTDLVRDRATGGEGTRRCSSRTCHLRAGGSRRMASLVYSRRRTQVELHRTCSQCRLSIRFKNKQLSRVDAKLIKLILVIVSIVILRVLKLLL